MRAGALLLRYRQTFGDGLSVAYYRDVIRPKILKAPPETGLDDKKAEIHVLTSGKDWLNLIWTLKSFYRVSPRRFPLCVHGDAGLPEEAVRNLRRLFPEARIILEKEARERVLDALAPFPNCRRLRETNTLAAKVFDFAHFLRSERLALFDSDLLFFAEPTEWLAYLQDNAPRVNAFNGDVDTAYALTPERLIAHGVPVIEGLNSGFGMVWPESLKLDWIEEFLSIPGLVDGHFWRIEQTLFALCSSRYGVELLPEDYRVYLKGKLEDRPFRHYVGAVRHLMYREGMRALAGPLLSRSD